MYYIFQHDQEYCYWLINGMEDKYWPVGAKDALLDCYTATNTPLPLASKRAKRTWGDILADQERSVAKLERERVALESKMERERDILTDQERAEAKVEHERKDGVLGVLSLPFTTKRTTLAAPTQLTTSRQEIVHALERGRVARQPSTLPYGVIDA